MAIFGRKRFVVMRHWQGNSSTMVPQATAHRFRRRAKADRVAARLNQTVIPFTRSGGWFDVSEDEEA